MMYLQKVKDRPDVLRDPSTTALIYTDTPQDIKIEELKSQINNMNKDIQEIKNILERIVNGR